MGKYNNVLVAYDGSELSKKALDVAVTMLEESPEGQLTIVSVWQLPNFSGEGAILDIGRITEDLKKHGQQLLDEAADHVKDRLLPVKKVLLQGHPSTEILEYAEKENVDLIVLGSRGLNSIQRLFLGSVSHRVVQEATCDVLVVK